MEFFRIKNVNSEEFFSKSVFFAGDTVKSIYTFVVRNVVVVVLFEEVCVGTLLGFATVILHENTENTKIKKPTRKIY